MKKKFKQKYELHSINDEKKLTKEQIINLENIVYFNKFKPSFLKPITFLDTFIYLLIFPGLLLFASIKEPLITFQIAYSIISLISLIIISLVFYYNLKYRIEKNIEIQKEFDKNMNILNFNKDNMNDVTIQSLKLLLIELKTLGLIKNYETNLTINKFLNLLNKKTKQLQKYK